MCLVSANIDPYDVLGISRDADEKTIKSAYRQLSKQYHPDKNSSPEAHDKFIEIGAAYDILGDLQKKQNFDQYGNPDGPQAGGGGDMNDFLKNFFGHGSGNQQRQRRKGGTTQVAVELSLHDFFLGKEYDFGVEMSNICGSCTGSGSADGKRQKCSKCKGSGQVTIRQRVGPMVQQFQMQCNTCQGSGSTIANLCKTCGGSGTERKVRQYLVFVAAGTPRNHVHHLEGEGDQHPSMDPGDLNFILGEKALENWGYRRIGNNLYRTEVLTADEAFFGGWKREIPLFDEEMIVLSRKLGQPVQAGEVEVFKGHGMPIMGDEGEYGDLFVDYKVLSTPGKGSKRTLDEL